MNQQPPVRTASDEPSAFLAAHPGIEHFDAIFIDLNGIVRGKRFQRDDLAKIYAAGFPIPYTIYLLDITGECSDPCGRGITDGDPDGVAVPVAGSMVPAPWSARPMGQVLMTLHDQDGAPSLVDPRNLAAAVVARFKESGLTPVVAFELEFYLVDRVRAPDGGPRPPIDPQSGARVSAAQVYGMSQLDAFRAFFEAVETACRAQRVPASVASTEYAPGQFEINLRHVADPLAAADHAALLRHIVKKVAQYQGMDATFMSKPFAWLAGNGMHVHVSLLDGAGKNVFDDRAADGGGGPDGGTALRHAVGGLTATLAEAMAIFAPNLNAFRRFQPNLFVPVTKSWAANNRSVAFRIPAGPGESRRIEHRVAGADANPYLVLAALLAGLHHGLDERLEPGPMTDGNAGHSLDPDLPLAWDAALDRLQAATILPGYLGRDYVDLYCATKRNELRRFNATISRQEYDWYL